MADFFESRLGRLLEAMGDLNSHRRITRGEVIRTVEQLGNLKMARDEQIQVGPLDSGELPPLVDAGDPTSWP